MTTIELSMLDGADSFRIAGSTAEQSAGSMVRIGAIGSGLAGGAFVVFGSRSGLGDMALTF